jgi:Na+/H+ antiporter NhaD/arsenite permease-like protein
MSIPTLIVNYIIKEKIVLIPKTNNIFSTTALERNSIFFLGLGCLLFVPIFKAITGLPPYMGMMLCLGMLWVLTEMIHKGKQDAEKGALSVNLALKKIDTASILFFFGILLSIAALDSSGILIQLATSLNEMVGNIHVIAFGIGLLSAIFDNVPLVASLQSMYSVDAFPTDHYFWELLAYATGTGGSCLIIGSAAGIAIMGIEKIDFFWYLKRVSWIALVGFISGMAVFMLEQYLVAL